MMIRKYRPTIILPVFLVAKRSNISTQTLGPVNPEKDRRPRLDPDRPGSPRGSGVEVMPNLWKGLDAPSP